MATFLRLDFLVPINGNMKNGFNVVPGLINVDKVSSVTNMLPVDHQVINLPEDHPAFNKPLVAMGYEDPTYENSLAIIAIDDLTEMLNAKTMEGLQIYRESVKQLKELSELVGKQR